METTVLFLFLLLPSLILSAILTKNRRKKQNLPHLPPGPSSLPLIGNFHQLDGKPPHEYFWLLSKKYGPLVYMKLGSRPVLAANSSRMAEEILKNQDLSFCSRPPLLALRKVSYNGFDIAFAPYSEYWREMRKTCMLHLLSAARVKSFRPVREDEVLRMIQKICQHISRSETINLTETLTFLTSTTICRVAFGKRYEPGSGESREFNQIIREFQTALSAFYFTDYFPWLGWIDKLVGKIDHLENICKKWDLFYQQLINEHLHPDRPKSMDGDVVDIMLQLREEISTSSDLPLDHIKAVLMLSAISTNNRDYNECVFCFYGHNSDDDDMGHDSADQETSPMKKAQAELRASLGKKQMVEEEDIDVARLPYFNALIKEAMRLYSTIPLLLPRETMQKCTINGFEIPAKTLVHVNAWAISKDPEQWENPNEFLPERFLEGGKSSGRDLKGNDYGFIPFGAGRRICPGMTMAMATVETVLANLLYLFDWELPAGVKKEDVDNDISPGITLHRKNPLYLVAKKSI